MYRWTEREQRRQRQLVGDAKDSEFSYKALTALFITFYNLSDRVVLSIMYD